MATVVPERFWNRRGDYQELVDANELLYRGEFCTEMTDVDGDWSMWAKIGNGVDHWRDMLWSIWGLFDKTDLVDGSIPQYNLTRKCWEPILLSGGGVTAALQFVADLGSVADSDPGTGLLKWNNATQASATVIFLDDTTDDGVSVLGIWPEIRTGGLLHLQHGVDQDTWQVWEITGVTDASGYVKLNVTLLADGGAFADGDPMLVQIQTGRGVAYDTHAATSKTTPVDNDEIPLVDSAASNVLKKLLWSNLKAGIWDAWGALINGGTGKTTPVGGDMLAIADSAASNATKKLTFTNLVAYLATSFATFAGDGPVTALTISSGVVNIDCSLGSYFTLALTANVTSITFSNLPAAGRAKTIWIRFKQDATGGRTVALPSSFKKTLGSDSIVQTAINSYTHLSATSLDQGTRWEYTMAGGTA